MSKKTNHRSIRFSDEVAAVIDGFGSSNSSFNDKLEQLILHCNLALPQIESEVAQKRKQLAELDKECREAKEKACDYRTLKGELDSLMVECRQFNKHIKDVSDKL